MAVRASDLGATTPMGATPASEGAYLRCSAPSATKVSLLCGGAAAPDPSDLLLPTWRRNLGGLRARSGDGSAYMFWIDSPIPAAELGSGPKRDPWARELAPQPAFPNYAGLCVAISTCMAAMSPG